MHHLNKKAAAIFSRIIAQLGRQTLQPVTLYADQLCQLEAALAAETVQTDKGPALVITLRLYDPRGKHRRLTVEMEFLTVDLRNSEKEYARFCCFPASLREPDTAVNERSVHLNGGRITFYIAKWQRCHCRYANQWLTALRQRGLI